MRTLLTLVFVLASLTIAILASADATRTAEASAVPSAAAVLPDTLPIAPLAFDWHASDKAVAAVRTPRHGVTVRAYPSTAPAAAEASPVRAWHCSAPRGLDSDETATVRVCEFR